MATFGRVVALLAALAPLGHAAEKEARALEVDGRKSFDESRFGDAAAAFEAAYDEWEMPRLLWEAALSYRGQYDVDGDIRHLRRASVALRRFTADDISDAARKKATAALAAIDRELLACGVEPAQTYERRRSKGQTLTIIALVNFAFAAVGGVLMSIDTGDYGLFLFPGMVTTGTAGPLALILLAVGVPVWAIAQRRLNRIMILPTATAGGGRGLALTWQF